MLFKGYVRVEIRSEGCDDPAKTPKTCGLAYIFVEGEQYAPQKRGYNVVVLGTDGK